MVGLEAALRDRLSELGRIRSLRRGERLIHEGSTNGAVVLVLEGTLRVTSVLGGEEVVLAIRGPGDLLGELGPLTAGAAGATVEAREPGRVVVMPSSRFVAARRDDPELAAAISDRLVELLAESDRRRTNALCRPLISRVAAELLHLVGDSDDGFPVTQSELGSLCVASRSAVAEALADLRDRGAIGTGRGRVTIHDHAALAALAEADATD